MEIEHNEVRRDGFFFDVQAFRLDLYRLISAFYASGQFARLARLSDLNAVLGLSEEFQESEITRLLVTVATTTRVIQDRERASKAAKALFDAPCGDFYPDTDTSPRTKERLTLREACNKIMHAERFNFDAQPLPASQRFLPYPTYTLRPVLHLYGKHKRVNWKARLDVGTFVRINAALILG